MDAEMERNCHGNIRMTRNTEIVFTRLFREAYRKCFHHELDGPMSESESKLLGVDIQEKTGLVLGFKSIKNYSIFISGGQDADKVNPSLASLDTLTRYVLNAPATSEQERSKNEGHYPFWHLYAKRKGSIFNYRKIMILALVLGIVSVTTWLFLSSQPSVSEAIFEENFDNVSAKALKLQSWELVNENRDYWQKRDEKEGVLRLFTLQGDNWPDSSSNTQQIRNLLMRPVHADCFNVEARIVDFFPNERWQQAGIILTEDSSLTGNVLRLSIVYNDYFGGFDSPPEIVIQGITSHSTNNPEEFLHRQVFQLDSTLENIIKENLKFCNFRIEKREDRFRFLLSCGPLQNGAFKEIGQHEFKMDAQYVGIFAIKGNVAESQVVPVNFDSFRFQTVPCDN